MLQSIYKKEVVKNVYTGKYSSSNAEQDVYVTEDISCAVKDVQTLLVNIARRAQTGTKAKGFPVMEATTHH